MIKLLEFLWYGCWHDWVENHRIGIETSAGRRIGTRIYFDCTKCKRVRVQDVGGLVEL